MSGNSSGLSWDAQSSVDNSSPDGQSPNNASHSNWLSHMFSRTREVAVTLEAAGTFQDVVLDEIMVDVNRQSGQVQRITSISAPETRQFEVDDNKNESVNGKSELGVEL
nr:hypothetical protein L203_04738 [Cryptococcus depauperatus CBS 7841]